MNGGQVATTLVIMSDVEYLLPLDTYQQHFVHIGTQQSSAHMVPFLEDQKQEARSNSFFQVLWQLPIYVVAQLVQVHQKFFFRGLQLVLHLVDLVLSG